MTMQTQASKKAPSRGFAILLVLGMAAVLAVFTAGIGAQAAQNLRTIEKRSQTDLAYYAAYSGIQLCLAYLREPPEDIDFTGDEVPDNWLEEIRSVRVILSSEAQGNGARNVQAAARVYHNIEGYIGAESTAPDGTVIPSGHFYIMALGEVDGVYDDDGTMISAGTLVEQTLMGASIAPDFPVMPQAIYAYEQFDLDGEVNHFNSNGLDQSQGAWNKAVADFDAGVPLASVAVGSPSAPPADAVARIGDDARINGHVYHGPDFPVDQFAGNVPDGIGSLNSPPVFGVGSGAVVHGPGNSTQVTGYLSELAVPKPMLDVILPDNHEVLSGGDLTLVGGKTYYLPTDLRLSGSQSVKVVAPPGADPGEEIEDVVLYVEGDIEFDGPGVKINERTAPRRLKIFSLNSDGSSPTNFTLMNNAKAYCLVAGNSMVAAIGEDSELWGAVIANDVRLSPGGRVLYDTTLRDPELVANLYGFSVLGTTAAQGAGSFQLNDVAPPPPPGAGTTTTTGGTTTTTGGGGCGCGCGGGSAMLQMKEAL